MVLILGTLLSLSLALTMPLSVILLSDIQPGTLPGETLATPTKFGFDYNSSLYSLPYCFENNWLKRPSFYPAFAEYSEPPVRVENISDTGRTLRAFLPFSTAQERENIIQYSGQTTVLDARVTCLPPTIGNLSLNDPISNIPTSNTTLVGDFQAISISFEGQGIVLREEPSTYIPFACSVSLMDTDQWPLSLCQIEDDYLGGVNLGLPSDFDNSTLGLLFMAINITGSPMANNSHPETNEIQGVVSQTNHGEWNELVWRSQGQETYGSSSVYNYSLSSTISLSLCFTAFDTADLPVQITGTQNRVEPGPKKGGNQMDYGDIRRQLGQAAAPLTAVQRGILDISPKTNWSAPQTDHRDQWGDAPYVQSYAAMAYSSGFDICQQGVTGNASACLFAEEIGTDLGSTDPPLRSYPYIHADETLVGIFQEVLANDGSIAFAVQCLITLLSSMAYYDLLPLFDKTGLVDQQFEIIANIPVRNTGLFVVIGIQIMHVLLTGVILLVYVSRSRYTTLGNPWQTAAQLISPETEHILAVSANGSKKDVDAEFKGSGHKDHVVKLGEVDGKVHLIEDTCRSGKG